MYSGSDMDILLASSKKCAPPGTRHIATLTTAIKPKNLSSMTFLPESKAEIVIKVFPLRECPHRRRVPGHFRGSVRSSHRGEIDDEPIWARCCSSCRDRSMRATVASKVREGCGVYSPSQ